MPFALTAFLAYITDLVVGDPPRLPHPVLLMGKVIDFLDSFLNKPNTGAAGQVWRGSLMAVAVVMLFYFATAILLGGLYKINLWLGLLVEVWLVSTTISARGLALAARDVLEPLKSGDLQAARAMVGRIVGRDTRDMSPGDITRATVETVAENAVDGVIAPLFYCLLGGAPLAMAYRAVNTLDSMVGYRNAKYLYFGRCSARLDDIANYIPARWAGLMLIAAAWLSGRDSSGAAGSVLRDAGLHPSPNSGFPEAAVAGALGIRLGGQNTYGGVTSFRAHMGNGPHLPQPQHIRGTVDLMFLASALALATGVLLYCFILIGF